MARDFIKKLLEVARIAGVCDAEIVRLRRHFALVGTLGGRPIKHIIPGTPSDCRSQMNNLMALRRLVHARKSAMG